MAPERPSTSRKNISALSADSPSKPQDPIDEILAQYRNEPAADFIPTDEAQVKLAQAVQNKDPELFEESFENFLPMVAAIAHAHKGPNRDSKELLQTARTSLIEAAKVFPRNEEEVFLNCVVELIHTGLTTKRQEEAQAYQAMEGARWLLDYMVSLGIEPSPTLPESTTVAPVSPEKVVVARPERPQRSATKQETGEARARARIAARERQTKLDTLNSTQKIMQPLLLDKSIKDMIEHVAKETSIDNEEATKMVETARKRFMARIDDKSSAHLTRSILVVDLYRKGYVFDVKMPPKPLKLLLTDQELQVVKHIRLPNKEIADKTGVTVKTVGNRIEKIISKTKARSRTEVALMVEIEGLGTEADEPAD